MMAYELLTINTAVFKAHLVKGAASTASCNEGITTSDILNAADWSTQSVFQKFYYKASRNTEFGIAALNLTPGSKNTNTH